MDSYDLNKNKAFEVIERIVSEVITAILPNFSGNISTSNTNLRKLFNSYTDEIPSNTAELRTKISNVLLKDSIYSLEEGKKHLFIHYTSIENCISIINEGRIRLYNINYLKDPNEYNYLSSFFKNSYCPNKEILNHMHIFSMCEYKDSNSENFDLWRLYGKEGKGAALVLEVDGENMKYWESLCIGKVDYNPDIKKISLLNDKCNELILKVSKHFEIEIEEAFSILKLLTKKQIYSTEKEIRIIKKATDGFSKLDFENNRIDGLTMNKNDETCSYTTIYLNNLVDLSSKINIKDRMGHNVFLDDKQYTPFEAELYTYPKINLKEIIIGIENNKLMQSLDDIIYHKQRKESYPIALDMVSLGYSIFSKDF